MSTPFFQNIFLRLDGIKFAFLLYMVQSLKSTYHLKKESTVKKISAIMLGLLCVSGSVMAKDSLKNPTKLLTITLGQKIKTVTYGEYDTIIDSLMAGLKEQAKNLSPEKKAAIKEMIRQYLASEASTLLLAEASGIDNDPEVKEKINAAREKIIKEEYKKRLVTAEQEKLTPKDFEDIKNGVVAEKGDQVTLIALSNFQGNDDARITKKIASLKTVEEKTKEWSKLSKNSGVKVKQLDPVLISEVPDILKSKLQNCKTGDVISIEIPDSSNPKNAQKTLFFVAKREKIDGDLLLQAVRTKMMDSIEKKIMARIMEQVKVQNFDEKGQPMAAPVAAKAA